MKFWKEPLFDFKSGSREWTILFQAKHPEVTLTFSHAGQQAYTGPFIDAITLKTVDEPVIVKTLSIKAHRSLC